MNRPGILADVAAGRPGAMEACIASFGGLVWALALRMSPGRDEAEEGVQEVFIDVWKHAVRYAPATSSESTFVAMIARRRLIDRHRRRVSRPLAASLDLATLPLTSARPAGHAIDVADEVAHVRRLLGQLRPAEREVLELALGEGLSHATIARRTGMPVGTVKSHARRGLIRLRELLAEASAPSPVVAP